MIGACTALIGDIAGHLGCFIFLKDSVNAIAFVALGTSVPGKFGWDMEAAPKNMYCGHYQKLLKADDPSVTLKTKVVSIQSKYVACSVDLLLLILEEAIQHKYAYRYSWLLKQL